MVHILRIKIGAVLSFHSGTVVRVWNCTPAKHGNKRKGKPKGSGKERAENERKRALAMASQIPTHCTMSSNPLFFCGNENMYNMLHAPVYGRTGSFGVSKRRATCPSLYPRKFLLRYRAAGRIPLGTLKLKSDEVTEETESEVATGTRKLRSLPGTLNLDWGKTNANLLFVAGATGGVGSRLVRELLKLGFQVRAGVRDFAKGDPLLEMAAEIKSEVEDSMLWPARLFQFLSPSQGKLELTECDLEKEDQIEVALGDAEVVICVVGASEKEVLDVTGPYRIDYKATKNLIDAASAANVKHFILVTSLGTAKFGWPASILNLFWGVLIWKAKAEKALKESGIPYTLFPATADEELKIVRPGGMERPTDAFKETHNLVLYRKDSLSGGQVSRLQVAELIACCVSNPRLSKNKVLEAIAETTAPLRPIEELLSIIPSEDGETESDATPVEDAQSIAITGQASKISRREEEKKLAKKAKKLEKEQKRALCDKYEAELSEARETEKEAKKEAEMAASQKEQLEKKKKELQAQADAALREAQTAKALETASLNAARQGLRLSEKEKREIVAAVIAEIDSVQKVEEKGKSINTSAGEKKKRAESTARPAERKTEPIAAQIGTAVKEEDKHTIDDGSKNEKIDSQAAKSKAVEEEQARASAEPEKREERECTAEKEAATKDKEMALQAKAKEEEKAKTFVEETEKKERVAAGRKAEEDAATSKINEEEQVETSAEASEREQEAIQKAKNIAKIKAYRDEVAARESLALKKAKVVTFTWPWQAKAVSTAEFTRETRAESATEDAIDQAARKEEESRLKAEAVKRKADEEAHAKASAEFKRKEMEAPERKSHEEAAEINAGEEVWATAAAEASERKEKEVIEKDEKEDWDSIAEKKSLRKDVVAREQLALERAKAATSFTWPWQKNVDFVSSRESAAVHYSLPESEPQLPKLPFVNGPVSTISDDQRPLSSQPLSPYTRYPDLKPPASPTPQAPTSGNERSETIKEDLKPLAAAEEDLKLKETQWSLEEKVALVVDPASTEDVKERARLAKEAAEEAAARAALALEKAKSVATFSWPWKGEEALASSSFVTKNMSQSASASTNLPRPPRPLSPYTRYQDLKPPASPTPSPPKVVKLVNPTLAPTIKVKKSSNGAGEQQEKQELETANQSGFKWPWQA